MELLSAQQLCPIFFVFLASFIQSLTGFGLVIVAAPFLMIFYEPKLVVLLVLVITTVSNTIQAPLLYKDAKFKVIVYLVLGALVGQPLGIFMYKSISGMAVKFFVSFCIFLFLVLLQIFKLRIKECNRNTFITGVLSGFLATTTGMAGPPLAIYLAYSTVSPQAMRATSITYFFFSNGCSIIAFYCGGISLLPAVYESVYLLPALGLGLVGGHVAFRYVPAERFRQIVFTILFISCVYTMGTVLTNTWL